MKRTPAVTTKLLKKCPGKFILKLVLIYWRIWWKKLISCHLNIYKNETHFFVVRLSYHFPEQWPQTYILLPVLMLHTSRRDGLLLMWDWVSYLPQLTTEQPAEYKGLCTLIPMKTGSTLLANNSVPTVLDVTCCVRLRTLLHDVVCFGVVAQSLKPIKLLATCKRTQQLPTMLRPFAWGFMVNSYLVFQATFWNNFNHVDNCHNYFFIQSHSTVIANLKLWYKKRIFFVCARDDFRITRYKRICFLTIYTGSITHQ